MLEQSEHHTTSILVVDDNAANRTLARHALEDEGHQVVLASSGTQALACVEARVPDCILLDVRMPDMDGFSVCEQLRARGIDTPIIFLTALRDVDTFDRAMKAGGDDFLTKPVNPAELVVRVQAGLKLRRLRAELREHYDLLRHQRDALLRLQLQKERLMSFLIHDLKNPVNSMDLQAQMLMRSKEATPSVIERAGKIRGEARYLTRMLLNLLDLGKADEGRLIAKREAVSLVPMLDQIFSELEMGAQERKVTLHRSLAIDSIVADVDLLHRALTNLIENAIRHAPMNSRVQVQSTQSGGGVELRVSDQGAGVPLELREKIFEPFVQIETADSHSMTRNGRGLGLAFCKLVGEAHEGRIWVEDGAPGAVFCLSMPSKPAESHSREP